MVYRAARLFFQDPASPGESRSNSASRSPWPPDSRRQFQRRHHLSTLNEIYGLPFGGHPLGLAASLGADSPSSCSETGPGPSDRRAARTGGPLPSFDLVLLHPPLEVPTGPVYQGLNLGLTNGPINYSIPRFYTICDVAQGLWNDLESVTLKRHPELQELKNLLLRKGALGALMSGSGPSVFGVFEKGEDARRAAAP